MNPTCSNDIITPNAPECGDEQAHQRISAIRIKKAAIAQEIISIKDSIMEIAVCMRKPKKKLFQPKNRRPNRKNEMMAAICRKLIDIDFARMRIRMISQQPIPRFPKGGSSLGGCAVVGKPIEEVVWDLSIKPESW